MLDIIMNCEGQDHFGRRKVEGLESNLRDVKNLAEYSSELMQSLRETHLEIQRAMESGDEGKVKELIKDRKADQLELGSIYKELVFRQYWVTSMARTQMQPGDGLSEALSELLSMYRDVSAEYAETFFRFEDGLAIAGPRIDRTICFQDEDGCMRTGFQIYTGNVMREDAEGIHEINTYHWDTPRVAILAADERFDGVRAEKGYKGLHSYFSDEVHAKDECTAAIARDRDARRQKNAEERPEVIGGDANGIVNIEGKLFRNVRRVREIPYNNYGEERPAFDIYEAATLNEGDVVYIVKVLDFDRFERLGGYSEHNKVYKDLRTAERGCENDVKRQANSYGWGCGPAGA